MLTRRSALQGIAAIAAQPVVSSVPVISSVQTTPVYPAWEVGTPGGMDWHVVFAPDERAARMEWLRLSHGDADGSIPCEGPCSPDDCACYGNDKDNKLPPARRAAHFDHPQMHEPSDADKMEAGWSICCDRCGYETTAEENALAINGAVVCIDCATPAEIKAHDMEEYEHWLYNDRIEEAESGDKARLLARYEAEDECVKV